MEWARSVQDDIGAFSMTLQLPVLINSVDGPDQSADCSPLTPAPVLGPGALEMKGPQGGRGGASYRATRSSATLASSAWKSASSEVVTADRTRYSPPWCAAYGSMPS